MPCRNPCRLYIHLAFTYSVGPSSIAWSELGPAPPFFHQWECLKRNGHGLSVSCVKWPLEQAHWRPAFASASGNKNCTMFGMQDQMHVSHPLTLHPEVWNYTDNLLDLSKYKLRFTSWSPSNLSYLASTLNVARLIHIACTLENSTLCRNFSNTCIHFHPKFAETRTSGALPCTVEPV